ncbi:MAG: glycosyltransferase family 1 protein [Bdellovibrionales bacterium]|nr:glycosyltransferase family 1 protein [Bdellovibrionales bacterium]
MNPTRLCIFITHPNQHFSPLFNELAKHKELFIKVIYMFNHGINSSYDKQFEQEIKFNIEMTGNYEFVVLKPTESKQNYSFWNVNSSTLMNHVTVFKPDYVWVFGYNSLASWKLALLSIGKYKLCFTGDSSLKQKRSLYKKILKYFILRWFFKRVDLFFSVGEANENYYKEYGVSQSRMIRICYSVDKEYLLKDLNKKGTSKLDVKRELNIDPNLFLIGFSGKLVVHKRPQDILEMVRMLRAKSVAVGAIFVGAGSLEASLKNKIIDYEIGEWVKMVGFINQDEIGRYYNAMDVFVMPSSKEPFGMSLIEAQLFGKPIVASDKVGCVSATDIAVPNVNTLVYECGNIEMLAHQVEKLIKDQELFSRMGMQSARSAEKASVQYLAKIISTTLK